MYAIRSYYEFGRKISTSYEVIRQQRLDIFAATLRTIGAQVARAINAKAIAALAQATVPTGIAGDELTYNDLITFWSSFADYNLTSLIVSYNFV